ncbi:MAG: glycosyltransferase family 2 protein [Bacteroidales bacterium]|nr:glycosyltransferase family 2 protein [Bacteroidales bacterium]
MSAKVSFVVAVYNVAAFVGECVRSLCEQTMEDIEIVIVDDGSTDGSIEIVNQVLAQFPHRKKQTNIIRHQQNMDLPQTRWDGIMAAGGEYIIIVDGDDYVDQHMAEKLYDKAVETDADMVVCDHWIGMPTCDRVRRMAPDGKEGDNDNLREDIINLNVAVNTWCKLVRRTVYTDNDIVWPVKGYAEDVVVSTMTAYYSKRISYLAEPLYYYRYNPQSYSRGMGVEARLKTFEDYKLNQQILLKFFEREGLMEKYEEAVFKGKVRVKKHLLPLFPTRKYVRLYFKTYPEVDRAFLWGNKYRKPTYRERVWIAALWLGLYPRLKRRLMSKRFRPGKEWLP